MVIVLIGNKSDLKKKRQVSKAEGQKLANWHDVLFIETCANNNTNVKKVFEQSAKKIYKNILSGDYDLRDKNI